MKDAYKSLIEALSHGGVANNVKVNLDWIESEVFENEDPAPFLEHVDGILVPGGFGQRGAEGKIRAAQFAREQQVPYFGICFGMQMAVIEAARNLCGIEEANSTEFGVDARAGRWPDDRMDEGQRRGEARRQQRSWRHDAAWRLSGHSRPRQQDRRIYQATDISERHRHRYEVNTDYKDRLAQHGMRFSGMSPDGMLPEIIEYSEPSLVHRCAIPSRAEIAAVRAAPAFLLLHRGCGRAESAGVARHSGNRPVQ